MKKKITTYNRSILEVFLNSPKKKFNYRQIKSRIKQKNENLIKKSIELLLGELNIVEVSPGKYVLNKENFVIGIIDKTKKGSGYLVSEQHEKDFFITIKNINKALNGDKVICTIINKREAKVLDIIKRKKQKYVGVVIEENNKKLIEYNSNKDNFVFETREKK